MKGHGQPGPRTLLYEGLSLENPLVAAEHLYGAKSAYTLDQADIKEGLHN